LSSSALPTPTCSQTAHPYNPPQQQQQHQQPQQQQQRSYSDVTSNSAQFAEESTTTLKTFLDDFKGLFAQLVHQNSMILKMLSTLLNKYH
jgi:magnesium-transporting ATPase (P-type)